MESQSILFNFGNLNGKRSVSSYHCWFFMKKALCEGLISEVGEPEGTCCSIYHRSFFHQALLNAVCNNAPLPSICRHLSYFFGRGCKPLRFWSGALKDLKGKHLKMSKSWNSDTTLQSQKNTCESFKETRWGWSDMIWSVKNCFVLYVYTNYVCCVNMPSIIYIYICIRRYRYRCMALWHFITKRSCFF